MEKKFVCRCGKEFQSLPSLGGHSKWCSVRLEKKLEELSDPSKSRKMKASGNSSSKALNNVQKESGKQVTTIKYRCVTCFEQFPGFDDFQVHYQTVHLGIDVAVQQDNDAKTGSEKSKRSLNRILSSSEDEDEISAKKNKTEKKPVVVEDTSNDEVMIEIGEKSTEPATKENASEISDPPVNHSISRNQGVVGTSPLDNPMKKGDDSGSGSGLSRLPSDTPIASTVQALEITNDLLKGMTSISKPYKALILGFVSGQRVNPQPWKGPILNILLDEKIEKIRAEDGSEKRVRRETYVSLNYETGKCERVENVKPILSSPLFRQAFGE